MPAEAEGAALRLERPAENAAGVGGLGLTLLYYYSYYYY